MQYYAYILLVFFFCSSGLSMPVLAEQTGDSIYFNFSGTMKQSGSTCVVNNAQPITVEFGNVGISKIDKGIYLQDLDYTLNCNGITATSKLSISIDAITESWNSKAIATSVEGLGVQVLYNGSPMNLNVAVDIDDPSSPPMLQVLLIKDSDAILSEQAFTATGTFVAEYI